MTGSNALDALERGRIVPVVVIDDAAKAHDLAITLRDAGIPTAEVTLRTPAALDAIREMSDVEGFVVGAGTILSAADVDAAIGAGAHYLVSPGLDEQLVQRAEARDIPFVPGIATPTEVQRAHTAGLTHVKLFPAGAIGGRALIDALSGPFPHLRYLPSGGVTLANMPDYLASPSVFAVSGSWMVPRQTINAGDFGKIAQLATGAALACRR